MLTQTLLSLFQPYKPKTKGRNVAPWSAKQLNTLGYQKMRERIVKKPECRKTSSTKFAPSRLPTKRAGEAQAFPFSESASLAESYAEAKQ